MQDTHISPNGNGQPDDDFSDVPILEQVSPSQIALDVWFFQATEKGVILKGIYWAGCRKLLEEKGIRKMYPPGRGAPYYVKKTDNKLRQVEIPQIQDLLLEYVEQNYQDGISYDHDGIKIEVSFRLLLETWLKQQHLITNDKFLGHLSIIEESEILRDDRHNVYILFKNGVVVITIKGHKIVPYEDIEGYVWEDHIVDREYTFTEDWDRSQFAKFHVNVSKKDPERLESQQTTTGFLIHNYSHQSINRLVIANDETITDVDTPEGGTGKGLFLQAVFQVRNGIIIDGKKFDERNQFIFQQVTVRTQVMGIDDLRPKKGVVDRFNSVVTEGIVVEHKNKPAFHIPPERTPKIYITSNAILDSEGNTRKRRQHIIEFGPYYSDLNRKGIKEPIIHEHGGRFFDDEDWDQDEWDRFYSYLIYCTELYFRKGLVQAKLVGVTKNRLIQTTSSDFVEWIASKDLKVNVYHETRAHYEDFINTYHGQDSDVRQRGFTNWLKKYCALYDYEFKVGKPNGVQSFMIKATKSAEISAESEEAKDLTALDFIDELERENSR